MCIRDRAGNGVTVWQGTALEECDYNSIVMHHSRFVSGFTFSATCGASGPVVGRVVSVVNDSYTSQLSISVSQHLIGSIIECASDNGIQANLVGGREIILTTGTTLICIQCNINTTKFSVLSLQQPLFHPQTTSLHLRSAKGNLPCLLYTSPSPRDATLSRMPSSA